MQWDNASILVTGGTGSFGRRFIQVLLKEYSPRRVAVFSRDEVKQMEMRTLFQDGAASPVRYFLGDVRDLQRLHRAMKDVDIVVHAAALKQVPACEYNPFEAVQTNILGSKNVIDACLDCGVKRAIMICTDKAVNPVNLYGATKLCAEKLFVHANAYSGRSGTRFCAARYGNVVGSRGSVIPVFLEQRRTGKISITDERMTRFWITLEQGVRFVMRALELSVGGEVFVPKIPSMRVTDLADVIAPACERAFTGVRPGEKLHEVLLSEDEARHAVEHDGMYVVLPEHPWWEGYQHVSGEPLPVGFSYRSDNNPMWLSSSDLQEILEREVPWFTPQQPISAAASSAH